MRQGRREGVGEGKAGSGLGRVGRGQQGLTWVCGLCLPTPCPCPAPALLPGSCLTLETGEAQPPLPTKM